MTQSALIQRQIWQGFAILAPSSDRNDGVTIYLPTTLPAQPRPGDVLTDAQPEPTDYLVTGAWETSLGWQVNAIIRTP